MPRSYASTIIAAEPDAVWAYLRNFDATPDFVDAVTASEILDGRSADQVGCDRRLTFGDGAVAVERLVALSDLDRSYTYTVVEGPFPFTRYHGTVRVVPVSADGTSFVEWWGTYDCAPDDEQAVDELLGGALFGKGLAAVREHFAAPDRAGCPRVRPTC